MISNITQGSNFAGAARYVTQKDGAEQVAGNMAGRNVDELNEEWQSFREVNDRVKEDVYHASLSLPEGETLTDDEWKEAAETYVEEMGFDDSAWTAHRHQDTDHDHVHILANRVDIEGKAVDVWQSHRRSAEVCRKLERRFDLERVDSPEQTDDHQKKPTQDEKQMMERTGEDSKRVEMQKLVDGPSREADEMGEYAARLRERGVYMEIRRRDDGDPYGVTYVRAEDGAKMKGSDLGRAYGWGGLQKKAGIDYDADRDETQLERSEWRDGQAVEDVAKMDRDKWLRRQVDNQKAVGRQSYKATGADRLEGTIEARHDGKDGVTALVIVDREARTVGLTQVPTSQVEKLPNGTAVAVKREDGRRRVFQTKTKERSTNKRRRGRQEAEHDKNGIQARIVDDEEPEDEPDRGSGPSL